MEARGPAYTDTEYGYAAQRGAYFVVEAREKLALQLAKLVVFQHDALISTIGT